MEGKDIKEKIFIALGEASMCWESIEKAGEFQSEKAVEIGDRLVNEISINMIDIIDVIHFVKWIELNSWTFNFENKLSEKEKLIFFYKIFKGRI